MKLNYSISIPQPCNQLWSKMAPNEKGRFCQSCSKTVVDFTKMNTEDIHDYIHKNRNQRICGHINQSQLDTINLKIPETIFNQKFSFNKIFLMALLFSMGVTLLNCEDEKGQIKKIENIEIVEKQIDTNLIKAKKSVDTLSSKKIKDSSKIVDPPIPIVGDIAVVYGTMVLTPNNQPYPYNYVDEMPKFLDTPSNLSKDEEREFFHNEIKTIIDKNFNIEQVNLGLKGKQRIYCQFEITDIGLVKNLKIRAPHPKYDDEVKRVFELFPKFIPAKHNGENVSTLFTLPIVFVIED